MNDVRHQVANNDPEIKSAQVWQRREGYLNSSYPYEVRIVCRYPFADPGNGRMWIIEGVRNYQQIERIPESSLRAIFQLHEQAPEV